MSHEDAPQLTLDGFAPQRPEHRLFLGLFPDPATRDAIAALAEDVRARHALHGKPLRAERLHLTLHHLGDHVELREDLLATVRSAMADFVHPAVAVELDRIASFASGRHRHPLVLRGTRTPQPVHDLHAGLGRALSRVGLGRYVQRQFEPHVTLLYDAQRVAAEAVEPPVRWTASRIVLIHSLLGRTEYREMGAWPLLG